MRLCFHRGCGAATRKVATPQYQKQTNKISGNRKGSIGEIIVLLLRFGISWLAFSAIYVLPPFDSFQAPTFQTFARGEKVPTEQMVDFHPTKRSLPRA